jgi:hypothetical protein
VPPGVAEGADSDPAISDSAHGIRIFRQRFGDSFSLRLMAAASVTSTSGIFLREQPGVSAQRHASYVRLCPRSCTGRVSHLAMEEVMDRSDPQALGFSRRFNKVTWLPFRLYFAWSTWVRISTAARSVDSIIAAGLDGSGRDFGSKAGPSSMMT